MYSAQLGRFCSRDPAGYADGHNSYAAYFAPNRLDSTGTHYHDAFGKWCCDEESLNCEVSIGVRAPCRSVREQIGANIGAGLPIMNGVVTGHAWVTGSCGGQWFSIGLYAQPNPGDTFLDCPAVLMDERPNIRQYGFTYAEQFKVCPETFRCFWRTIHEFADRLHGNNPPRYCAIDIHAGGSVNCSMWVADVFSACGNSLGLAWEPWDLSRRPGMQAGNRQCLPDHAGRQP